MWEGRKGGFQGLPVIEKELRARGNVFTSRIWVDEGGKKHSRGGGERLKGARGRQRIGVGRIFSGGLKQAGRPSNRTPKRRANLHI
jgi:hypothetical protein